MKKQQYDKIMENSGILSNLSSAISQNNPAGSSKLQKGIRHLLSGRYTHYSLSGLSASSKAYVVAEAYNLHKKPILLVAHSKNEAESLFEDLVALLGIEYVNFFPDHETLPYEFRTPHFSVLSKRIECLYDIISEKEVGPKITVTNAIAFSRKIVPKSELKKNILKLKKGDMIEPSQLLTFLIDSGFRNQDYVEEIGTFANRGGIIDLYPYGTDNPYRIEFFDIEIESIREFSVTDQASLLEREEVVILPQLEVVSNSDLKSRIAHISDERLSHYLLSNYKDQVHFEGIEQYVGEIYSEASTIRSYYNEHFLILDERNQILAKNNIIYEDAVKLLEKQVMKKKICLEPEKLFVFKKDLFAPGNEHVQIMLENVRRHKEVHLEKQEYNFDFTAIGSFNNNFDLVNGTIEEYLDKNYRIFILCSNEGVKTRMEEIFEAYQDKVQILPDTVTHGFASNFLKIAVFTDHEIFSRKKAIRRFRRFSSKAALKDHQMLEKGDYVVHINHGIGIYRGIKQIEADNYKKDCIILEYAGSDILYVPTDQLNLIQKYSSATGIPPKIHRIGGDIWEKEKKKTRKKLIEITQDLIKLYAERMMKKGISYSPDTIWQKEFEAAFIHEETPDQETSINDVKGDMEKTNPMDRLLCGDVGYGKTEVAMRAAFKAVMDSKQVAILVPTTILAQQHYETFRERFAGFPVNINILSRFKSPREKKGVIEELKLGKLDMVIGTHQLLGKAVGFKDLGLLIIDEEHRFGVRHKEKLKNLRKNVDVLTMSATPIPRTLYFSLSGIRDISIINTPPKEKLPIITEVTEFSEEIIRDAIIKELERDGQIFFVHNRVQTIDQVAIMIKKIVPDAEVAIVHGQMDVKDIEKRMTEFVAGVYDVLVATTIIEAGLDIPRVNTLIVNRADRLGIAQLHQLRGRVGRADTQAFAYFLIPSRRKLTDEAYRRLKAITEFDELGAGFKLAMRDMEIRGSGNLLGAQQHGIIHTIGFETYKKILNQAVNEIREIEEVEPVDVDIDIDLERYIPEDYIKNQKIRVDIYKDLDSRETVREIADFGRDLKDRFGKLPQPVENVVAFQKIKVMAAKLGLERLVSVDKKVIFAFLPKVQPDEDKMQRIMAGREYSVGFKATGNLTMTVTWHKAADNVTKSRNLIKFLEKLTEF